MNASIYPTYHRIDPLSGFAVYNGTYDVTNPNYWASAAFTAWWAAAIGIILAFIGLTSMLLFAILRQCGCGNRWKGGRWNHREESIVTQAGKQHQPIVPNTMAGLPHSISCNEQSGSTERKRDRNATRGVVRVQVGEVPVWPKEGLEQQNEDIRLRPRSGIETDRLRGWQEAAVNSRGVCGGTEHPHETTRGCLSQWQLVRERVRKNDSLSCSGSEGAQTHGGLSCNEMNPRATSAPPMTITSPSKKHSHRTAGSHAMYLGVLQTAQVLPDDGIVQTADVAAGKGSLQRVSGRGVRGSSSDESSQSTPMALRGSNESSSSSSSGNHNGNGSTRKSSNKSTDSPRDSTECDFPPVSDSDGIMETGILPAAARVRSGEFQAHYAAVLSRVTEEGVGSFTLAAEGTGGGSGSVPESQTSSELRHGCMIATRVNSEVFKGMVANACGTQAPNVHTPVHRRAGGGGIAGKTSIPQGEVARKEISAGEIPVQLVGCQSHMRSEGPVNLHEWQVEHTVGHSRYGHRHQRDGHNGRRDRTRAGVAAAADGECVVDVPSARSPVAKISSRFNPHDLDNADYQQCSAGCCVAGGEGSGEKSEGGLSEDGLSGRSSSRVMSPCWRSWTRWTLMLLAFMAATLAICGTVLVIIAAVHLPPLASSSATLVSDSVNTATTQLDQVAASLSSALSIVNTSVVQPLSIMTLSVPKGQQQQQQQQQRHQQQQEQQDQQKQAEGAVAHSTGQQGNSYRSQGLSFAAQIQAIIAQASAPAPSPSLPYPPLPGYDDSLDTPPGALPPHTSQLAFPLTSPPPTVAAELAVDLTPEASPAPVPTFSDASQIVSGLAPASTGSGGDHGGDGSSSSSSGSDSGSVTSNGAGGGSSGGGSSGGGSSSWGINTALLARGVQGGARAVVAVHAVQRSARQVKALVDGGCKQAVGAAQLTSGLMIASACIQLVLVAAAIYLAFSSRDVPLIKTLFSIALLLILALSWCLTGSAFAAKTILSDTCTVVTISASDVPSSPFLALLPPSFSSPAARNAVSHAIQAANGLVTAVNAGIVAINRAYEAYNGAGGGSGGGIAPPPSEGVQVSKVQSAREVTVAGIEAAAPAPATNFITPEPPTQRLAPGPAPAAAPTGGGGAANVIAGNGVLIPTLCVPFEGSSGSPVVVTTCQEPQRSIANFSQEYAPYECLKEDIAWCFGHDSPITSSTFSILASTAKSAHLIGKSVPTLLHLTEYGFLQSLFEDLSSDNTCGAAEHCFNEAFAGLLTLSISTLLASILVLV